MTEDATGACVARVTTMPFDVLERLASSATASRVARWLEVERGLDAEAVALGDELYRLAGPAGGADSRARAALLAMRRDLHNRRSPREPGASSALPQPLATQLASHFARRERHRLETELLVKQIERDMTSAEQVVIKQACEPLAAEGLRLVGRSLLEKVRRAAALEPEAWRHEQHQVAAKAIAYLGRFTTKTSPNGVFCATARAVFRRSGPEVRGENRIGRLEVRLNVGEARKVTACLAVDPALESIVVPRPNPTLRRTGTGWTYWKPASPRNADDIETRAEVPDHPVLAAFLAEAARGTLTVPALIAAAAARCGLDAGAQETLRFYRKLVAHGLLIAEIEVAWSAWRPLAALARACRSAGAEPAWLAEAESIERAVDELGDLSPDARPAAMDAIGARLDRLPHNRPLAVDDLFRADAATTLEIALPDVVRDEMARFMSTYARFYAAMYPAPLYRAGMVRRFLSRYPADTDVELLDIYHGMFEPTAQPRPAAFPEPHRAERGDPEWSAAAAAYQRLRDYFVTRAHEADGADEITLSATDWDRLLGDHPAPPYICGVLFQVAARDINSLANGHWRACLNAIYPGGGLSLSRLASLHGPTGETPSWIEDELRRGHRWLARDGAVLAEVSFMHAARTANAGLRPPLLAHEIELPGDRATPGANALPISDLAVRFDTSSGKFHLRSRSRGVRVVPIVSSGISAEGIVSFLVEIGRQGTQPLAHFPGFEVDDVTAWPRVRCGNIVLFRRRWRFAASEVPRTDSRRIEAAAHLEVARWRERHRLPRHVFVHTSEEPKPFYVDLESLLFVSWMLRTVPGPNRVAGREPAANERATPKPWALHVTEMLPAPDELWAHDAAGHYASEFLLHLAHPAAGYAAARSAHEDAQLRAGTW